MPRSHVVREADGDHPFASVEDSAHEDVRRDCKLYTARMCASSFFIVATLGPLAVGRRTQRNERVNV